MDVKIQNSIKLSPSGFGIYLPYTNSTNFEDFYEGSYIRLEIIITLVQLCFRIKKKRQNI